MGASWTRPARLVTASFAVAALVGTLLLLLPAARTPGSPADLLVAAFTTVSALCVTGLITVDTATYWTPFGQAVILVLIHVGGCRRHGAGDPAGAFGAHHVIYPELIMGQRVAHMVTGGVHDYLELGDGIAVARCAAPSHTWDQDLATSALRTRHRITVAGVKRADGGFVPAAPDTVVHQGDDLVLAGTVEDVERFTALTRRGLPGTDR